MSDLIYEFLSYESFPNDQYIKEVVEVCLGGGVILPYQHIKMKDGGTFWSFCGCSATKSDGTKKRINADFESKSFKRRFDNDLESFIKSKSANATVSQQTSNFGQSQIGVGDDSGQLPF